MVDNRRLPFEIEVAPRPARVLPDLGLVELVVRAGQGLTQQAGEESRMMNLPGVRQFVDQYLAPGLIRRASDILLNVRLQRVLEVIPHVDQYLAVGDPRHREFAREEAGGRVGRVVQIGEEYSLDRQGALENLEGEVDL